MSKRCYIDYVLIRQNPNKYNIKPKDIKKLKVLDWNKLKENTWFNQAMNKPCWCHLEGAGKDCFGESEDDFWIGFFEDGKIDFHFSAYGGMCGYKFNEFYKAEEIENEFDMEIQVKAINYLNKLLDEKIISF